MVLPAVQASRRRKTQKLKEGADAEDLGSSTEDANTGDVHQAPVNESEGYPAYSR